MPAAKENQGIIIMKPSRNRYQLRRPISNDPTLRREGLIVSTHRNLENAQKALARQQREAKRQGGYSQDYIWDRIKECAI